MIWQRYYSIRRSYLDYPWRFKKVQAVKSIHVIIESIVIKRLIPVLILSPSKITYMSQYVIPLLKYGLENINSPLFRDA